ncbi:MAG: holo-ACP synthase [Elusimicrobiota bacterium]
MIFGIGTDIIEVDRVGKRLAEADGFREATFTPREIAYCESKRGKARNYAARFAAKEAFLKATGMGWRDGLSFAQIEVLNDALGRPSLALSGEAKRFCEMNAITAIHVSLSHIADFSSAVVVLEK